MEESRNRADNWASAGLVRSLKLERAGATHMTRFWTIPVLAAAVSMGACSKQTTEAPPAAGESTAPAPAAGAPSDAARPSAAAPSAAAPSAATAPAPRPAAPARPASKPAPESRPLQNTAATPAVREPAAPSKPTSHEATVKSGTELPLELLTALTSESAAVEDEVRARLKQAVTVNGETVIPNGSTLIGSITQVERAGRVQGKSHLSIRFTEVTFSGQRHRLNTEPLSFEGESSTKDDVTKVGAGAGIGAVIGGILGGGKGAAKGAAIGGAAGGGAVLATRGKDVELASGTALTAVLAAPLTMTIDN